MSIPCVENPLRDRGANLIQLHSIPPVRQSPGKTEIQMQYLETT